MEHIKFSGFVKAEYPHSDNCRVIFPPNSIGFFVFVPYVWHCTRPLFINHILQYIQSQAELSSFRLSTLKYVASKFKCHINFGKLFFLSCNNVSYYHHNLSSLLVDFLLLLLYHFSVAKTRCRKVYCMRNTLSNISQKNIRKKEYIIIVPNWFGKLY